MKKSNRLLKWMLGLAASILILGMSLLALLISRLPAPSRLAHALQGAPQHQFDSTQNPETDHSPRPVSEAKAPSTAESGEKSERQKQMNDYFFRRYVDDPTKSEVQVCEHLSEARDLSGRDAQSLDRAMSDVFSGKKSGDPYLEAFLGSLRPAFQIQSLRDLIQEVRSLPPDEEAGFVKKAEFYGKVAGVLKDMYVTRPLLEESFDKGYLLYNLALVVRENPSLIGDAYATEICEKLQTAMNDPKSLASDDARKVLSEFFSYASVTPEQIGYDPSYRTHIDFVRAPGNIQVNHTWFDLTGKKPKGAGS